MTAAGIAPATRALLVAALFFIAGLVDHLYSYVAVEAPWAYWASDFVEQVLFSVALLWLILRLTGWRLRDFGLALPRRPVRLGIFLAMVGAGSTMLVVAAPLTEALTGRLGIVPEMPEGEDAFLSLLPDGQALRFLAVVYTCAVSGMFEELFYRGVLWRALVVEERGHLRKVIYVLVSSVLFGIAHTEQGLFGVVSNILWGAVGALLLLVLRNLWPLVLGHAATNFIEYLPFLALDAPPSAHL